LRDKDCGPQGQQPEPDTWWVYVVSCADDTLYTGIAKDPEARAAKHNAGTGAKYTRTRLPVRLVYKELHEGRGRALQREHAIKRLTLEDKRLLIGGETRVKPGGAGPSSPGESRPTPAPKRSRSAR